MKTSRRLNAARAIFTRVSPGPGVGIVDRVDAKMFGAALAVDLVDSDGSHLAWGTRVAPGAPTGDRE